MLLPFVTCWEEQLPGTTDAVSRTGSTALQQTGSSDSWADVADVTATVFLLVSSCELRAPPSDISLLSVLAATLDQRNQCWGGAQHFPILKNSDQSPDTMQVQWRFSFLFFFSCFDAAGTDWEGWGVISLQLFNQHDILRLNRTKWGMHLDEQKSVIIANAELESQFLVLSFRMVNLAFLFPQNKTK